MLIESVKAVFPSRKVTNDDVLELVRRHSEATFQGDLAKALDRIESYLRHSGSETRFWLADGERPITLILKAAEDALADAGCRREDIGLLVYVGVDRGFQEPGNSHFVADALGMRGIHCFDLLDGCMSWSRALQLIYALFRAGTYKRAMVVNGEFSQTRKGGIGYPKGYSLQNMDEIEWSWPGATVGEAATATILSHQPDRTWEFCFSCRNDLAALCYIPMEGYEGYCIGPIEGSGPGRFTSFGKEMHKQGASDGINVLKRLAVPIQEVRQIFPHASSKKAWHDAARSLGVENRLYHIYPRYGNVVSASVPAGMALAIAEGKAKRGDTVIGWVGSSGMSFAAYSFIY
jgi:3-oxoacyl-[acyl-carrier-protein] synthase III